MIPKQRRPGWQYWAVADLFRDGVLDIGDGYRAKNSEMGESGLPFARAGNLNNGFHFDDADILSEESVRLAGSKISKSGDITFTSKGTFGRFAMVRENTPRFVYSPQLCYWRVKQEGIVDRSFLYYWMQGDDCMNQLNEVKGLTDMADYVSLTNQRRMWLSAPPLPVQRRIAGILSAYDELIENSQRRIRILEEMARSLYREWFVRFRFPGHENHPLVSSVLGDIPEGWEVKKLKDVCHLTMGQSPKSEFYNDTSEGQPFHQGVTNFGERFPTDRLFCTVKGRIAESGDILFSVRAPVGRMNIADKKIIIGRGLSAIRHKDGHQAFLWEQLRNRFTKDDMIGNGAIFAAVTKDDMQGIELVCPTVPLVLAAIKHFEPIHSELGGLTKQIQNLRRTCDFLVQRLLSGKLDISIIGA